MEATTAGRCAPFVASLHHTCQVLQLCSHSGVGGMVVGKVLRRVGNAKFVTRNAIGSPVQRVGCAELPGGS